MGATAFLSGIIHAFLCTLFLYTWYWTGFNTWQRFPRHRPFYHFITWWAFLLQTLYFTLIFCCDIIKVFFQPSCEYSVMIFDMWFTGLVLPLALHVGCLFWVMQALSRLFPGRWPFPKGPPLARHLTQAIAHRGRALSISISRSVHRSNSNIHEENPGSLESGQRVISVEKVCTNNNLLSPSSPADTCSPDSSELHSRHVSFDDRSEHIENLSTIDGHLDSNQSSGASLSLDDKVLQSEYPIISPGFYPHIPEWVNHVTHSVVVLSAFGEALLAQPRAVIEPPLLHALPSTAFIALYSICVITSRLLRSQGFTISYIAMCGTLLVNALLAGLFGFASYYLNICSNFLHKYINIGLESAVVQ